MRYKSGLRKLVARIEERLHKIRQVHANDSHSTAWTISKSHVATS